MVRKKQDFGRKKFVEDKQNELNYLKVHIFNLEIS
jgi:hypothetical protein